MAFACIQGFIVDMCNWFIIESKFVHFRYAEIRTDLNIQLTTFTNCTKSKTKLMNIPQTIFIVVFIHIYLFFPRSSGIIILLSNWLIPFLLEAGLVTQGNNNV